MPRTGTSSKTRTMNIRKREGARGTRWEARWREADGSERSKTFPSEDEAQAHLDHVRHGQRVGTYVSPARSRTPLRTVADAWLDAGDRKPRTLESYRLLVDKWFEPWLDRAVGNLSYSDIAALIGRMRDADRKPQTIRNVLNVLNGVLEHAVSDGLIVVNPMLRVKANKALVPSKRSGARTPLTAAEVLALTEHVAKSVPSYGLVLRFAAWSGLRAGEIAGLRVKRLDPLRNVVSVEETVVRLTGKRWQPGTPKSDNSTRKVPIAPTLMRELTAHVAARGLGPDDYVFCDHDGAPLNHPAMYRRYFEPAALAIGRPDLHFHDLRHTYASLMAPNTRMEVLSKQMGHGTIAITMDLYTHLYEDDDPDKAAALDALYTSASTPARRVVGITEFTIGTR
jgi:integrase